MILQLHKLFSFNGTQVPDFRRHRISLLHIRFKIKKFVTVYNDIKNRNHKKMEIG